MPRNPNDPGVSDGHLQTTLRTVQEIARLLRTTEHDGDVKVFYADLTAYCAVICDHSSRINQAGHLMNPELKEKILHHLGSILVPDGYTLAQVIHRWAVLRIGHSDVERLDFVRSHTHLGGLVDTCACNTFIRSLALWEDELRSSYPEDSSQWVIDGFAPVKKTKEPSHFIWTAARSVLGALTACKRCVCTPNHQFSARLCLGTYRKPDTVVGDLIDIGEEEVDFDLFLSMEREWHEARVHAAKESKVQWQVEGRGAATERMKRAVPRPMRIKQLCEPIAKIRTMPSGASHRLELRVSGGKLFKLQSKRTTCSFDKNKAPISLHDILRSGPRSFTEKTRRILAVILSSAVLHLVDTKWLPSSWSSSDVLFLPTRSSAIPLRPFLQTMVPDPESSNDTRDEQLVGSEARPWDDEVDPDDLDPDDLIQHSCPAVVVLAIMLLEVYFAAPFDELASRFGVPLGDGQGAPKSAQYLDACMVFEACRGEIPENSQFHYAVEQCLDPTVWETEDGDPLDESAMRTAIYREIVQPLETELMQAYSSIPIDDLDRYAQEMNFASWDQPIPPQSPEAPLQPSQELKLKAWSPSPICPSPFSTPFALPLRVPIDQVITPRHHTDITNTAMSQTWIVEQPPFAPVNPQFFKFFDDEGPTEMQAESRRAYQTWRARYIEVYEKFVPSTCLPSCRVKIAILDTGVDMTHPDMMARAERIKAKYNLVNPKARHVHDRTGHGTFAAGLILDFAPDADIYIAKIAENEPCSPETIAEAINHAVSAWGVDMISMSFGFPTCNIDHYPKLETALKRAFAKDVLLFAAASNHGGQLNRSFPAREPTVIAVHSTDTNGNRSRFSPTPLTDDINLATVGEVVESAWPVHLCDEDSNPECVQHKSGTSFATPILVGISAFLVMYARINLPDKSAAMKSRKRMMAVLRRIADKGSGSAHHLRDGYHFVDLSLYTDSLFGRDKDFIDATLRDLLSN